MRTYFDLADYQEALPHPVISLGNFDGVHLGHQQIFRALQAEARQARGTDIVITFFPHPLRVLHPEKAPNLITTLEERLRLIEACGNTVTVCIPFSRTFAHLSHEEFVREVLVGRFGVRRILVGEDTRFGKDRRGDLAFLRESGKHYGFSVRRIEPVLIQGVETSSTRIRHCVRQGRIREAAAMLGRFYGISGKVREGEKRGRLLGFPTANLSTEAELLPADGVYAVWGTLGNRTAPGVANLGSNPTFPGDRFSVEVHLFDFDEDIYGRTLRVDFVERIREEIKFPSVHALVEQIRDDARRAREILAANPPAQGSALAGSALPFHPQAGTTKP